MKVLVTGVTGAIGADLAPRLIAAGHRVRGFARDPARVAVAGLDGVALGASIVVGGRSRSFRFLVRLVERVPVMPLPDWREHRTAPIDARDVMAYLVAAGTSAAIDGALSLDVGGPEVMTYAAMIERIRDAMLLARPRLDLPLSLTPVASRIAAAVAGEDPALIEPLMGSLGSDLLPRDDRARELF